MCGDCRAAENIRIVVWYLLLGGANAVLYNITHYRVIQITSSTATPVIGDAPSWLLCCKGPVLLSFPEAPRRIPA